MSKGNRTLIDFLFIVALVLAGCTFRPAAMQAIPSPTTEEVEAAIEEPVVTEDLTEESTAMPTAEQVVTRESTLLPPEEEAGTITLWHSWQDQEVESLREVITAFREQHPNVQFDVLYVPFDDLLGKFEASAVTGGGPDLLIGAADWGPLLYDSALVADLSGIANQELLDSINPVALAAVLYEGAIIGLPHEILRGVVMYRNPSIIPEAPTTFEELVESAKAATQGEVVGADLEYGSFFSAPHLSALGGQLMDEDGDPLFNSPEGIDWATLIGNFQEAGPVENNNDNDLKLFMAGRAGIIIDGSWNLASLTEATGAENVVVDPWPQGMSGYVQTENIYLSANSIGENGEAAWAFMEFFMSPEVQALLAEPTKAGHLPTVAGVDVSGVHQRQLLEAFAGGTPLPVIQEINAYWDPVNNALLSIVQQGADPAEALALAEEGVHAKLAEIRGGG